MKKSSAIVTVLTAILVIGAAVIFVLTLGIQKNDTKSSVKGSTTSAKLDDGTHIFMCADDGNAMPTCVTIASVLKNSLEDEKINIHIVSFEDNHMSDENVKKIESLKAKIKDFNLNFTYLNKNRLNEFNTDHWNKAIMVKLLGAELFPNLDKIIWLDDDVIVLKSLKELYEKNMDGKYLAGVDVSDEYNRFGNKNCPYWITAGLGVYNLKEIRKDNFQKNLLEFTKGYPAGAHGKEGYCGGIEEYALTKVPKDKMLVFPYKYSVMCSAFGKESYKNLALDDCVVLHFAGTPKPWRQQDHIGKKFADTWNKYYNMTPYAQQEKKAA